jgi:hypothetical protein
MIVLNAQGACRPYELRKGGSAMAIECSFSAEIFIQYDKFGNREPS